MVLESHEMIARKNESIYHHERFDVRRTLSKEEYQ